MNFLLKTETGLIKKPVFFYYIRTAGRLMAAL